MLNSGTHPKVGHVLFSFILEGRINIYIYIFTIYIYISIWYIADIACTYLMCRDMRTMMFQQNTNITESWMVPCSHISQWCLKQLSKLWYAQTTYFVDHYFKFWISCLDSFELFSPSCEYLMKGYIGIRCIFFFQFSMDAFGLCPFWWFIGICDLSPS